MTPRARPGEEQQIGRFGKHMSGDSPPVLAQQVINQSDGDNLRPVMAGKSSEPVTWFGTCHQHDGPSQINTVKSDDCASSHTRKRDMNRSAKHTTVMLDHREFNTRR